MPIPSSSKMQAPVAPASAMGPSMASKRLPKRPTPQAPMRLPWYAMGPRDLHQRGISKGLRCHHLLKHQTTRAAGWYARSADDAMKPTASTNGLVNSAPSVAHPALPASQGEPAALIPLKIVWDEQWQQWRCVTPSLPPTLTNGPALPHTNGPDLLSSHASALGPVRSSLHPFEELS